MFFGNWGDYFENIVFKRVQMYANSRNGTSMVGDAHGVLCEFSYEVVGLPLARILPVADAP